MKKHLIDILKIIVVIIVYVSVLLFIGPMIDHFFTSLQKDETNMEILGEIMAQLITVSVIWYYLNQIIFKLINNYINISNVKYIDRIIGIVSGLLLIGLQTHLHNKLKYITHEHPLRIFQIFEDKNKKHNINENRHSWKDVFG